MPKPPSQVTQPPKRRINSRAKGARGERAWRDVLRERGYTARRGQQFSGGSDSPDVICEELAFLHFEVKCVQSLNPCKVMREQASLDAGPKKMPVIAHKKDGKPWLVTLREEDFFTLLNNCDLPSLSSVYKNPKPCKPLIP